MIQKTCISPSLMCADICNLQQTLDIFRDTGIEYLHIDIMDGHFAPNFTLGIDYCRQLRKYTDIPLDIHMMVEEPENKLNWFDLREGDFVSVHNESTRHLQRVLSQIRTVGAKAMVSLNPATPIETLRYVLDDIDGVLLMTVNPGFVGQQLIPAMLDKIRDTREFLDRNGHPAVAIEVDGNVSPANATNMRRSGANIFVAGTASIFQDGRVTIERIERLRQAIRDGE